jgi:MFS family permease
MMLMPVFVKDIFRLDVRYLGIFMSASGIGTLIGALIVASGRTSEKLRGTIFYSAAGFGISVVAFGLSRSIPLTIVFMSFIGFFMVLQLVSANTFIQLATPDALRGRVMGFYSMAFMGFMPVGSLMAGYLAHAITAPYAVTAGGIFCIAVALIAGRKFYKQT